MSEYLCFCLQAKFFSARVYHVIVVVVKRCVMFKQWRIQANIRLRNVSSLVWGFMKKNELTKRTKKSEKTSFFVSIKQLPVKPISKKPRTHNVRQLAVVLIKRKSFYCYYRFFWTTEERDHPYLKNVHSRNAQAGKQTDMAAHSIVRGKWWVHLQKR